MDTPSYGMQWMPPTSSDDIRMPRQLIINGQTLNDEDADDEQVEQQEEDHAADLIANDDDLGIGVHNAHDYLVNDVSPQQDLDQIAAENLILMAQDGQMVASIMGAPMRTKGKRRMLMREGIVKQLASLVSSNNSASAALDVVDAGNHGGGGADDYTETEIITEEVITDDWVQHQGEERVEVPAEQIISSNSHTPLDNEVPLPTVEDEYTALRPYPCDFCSRRFRKKASLMNHMVAHQNDRPHLCKLCGSRFFRRSDLINHLKAHAETSDHEDDMQVIELSDSASFDQSQQSYASNEQYFDEELTMTTAAAAAAAANAMKSPKSNRKSSSTVGARGKSGRGKRKEEFNYTIDESASPTRKRENFHQLPIANTSENKCTDDDDASVLLPKLFPITDHSKPFVCQQCGLGFAREKALQSHTKTHRIDSPYECNQCNEIFWDTKSLQIHLRTHRFEESNSEFDPEEAAEATSDSELDYIYGEYYCQECGMSFHREDLLKRHMKLHVKKETTTDARDRHHCCNTCGETFAEALDLLAHAEVHARYPPFKCLLCGESFFDEAVIKRHLIDMHANDMTANSCVLCGKQCRDRKALMKHSWDHSREKCHPCSKCGKNFHNKARLKRHMVSHRDKSVKCTECDKEFPDGRSLLNHRHSHSSSGAGKLFACQECGKTFGSRSSQQIHVRIHTGERPYGCRFCWKAFADGGTLRKHERIHTGEKPYACSVCPRAFNQRVVLRDHIRSHHSGLDVKRGTYYCSICDAELSSSSALIGHLIEHSDMNTAMQRKPVMGPRKYKRRRKLKPHEIERLHKNQKAVNIDGNTVSDVDMSEFEMDNIDGLVEIPEAAAAKTKTRQLRQQRKRDHENGTATRSAAGGGQNADKQQQQQQQQQQLPPTTKRERHSSIEANSSAKVDWQEKLVINATLKEETYKSFLSNLENSLDCVDSLVVSSSDNVNITQYRNDTTKEQQQQQQQHEQQQQQHQQSNIIADKGKILRRKQVFKTTNINGSTTMTTPTTTTTTAAAKAKVKRLTADKTVAKPLSRPRMIHTAKVHLDAMADASTGGGGAGGRRRSKVPLVAQSEPKEEENSSSLPLLVKASSVNNIVHDYEIISPDLQPPNKIASSPVYNIIKQENNENENDHENENENEMMRSMRANSFNSQRSDLYDAQLLLEASMLRRDNFDKFNAHVINDFDEIFRSPCKLGKGRHRLTSESSTVNFLAEQSESEEHNHHMIKIEPTSPNIHDFIVSSGANCGVVEASSSSSHSKRGRRRRRRRPPPLLPPPPPPPSHSQRKYLNYTEEEEEDDEQDEEQQVDEDGDEDEEEEEVANINHHLQGENASNSLGKLSGVKDSLVTKDFLAFTATSTVCASSSSPISPEIVAAIKPTERKQQQRYFECEMCSAIFPDRAQLLVHVPIHI